MLPYEWFACVVSVFRGEAWCSGEAVHLANLLGEPCLGGRRVHRGGGDSVGGTCTVENLNENVGYPDGRASEEARTEVWRRAGRRTQEGSQQTLCRGRSRRAAAAAPQLGGPARTSYGDRTGNERGGQSDEGRFDGHGSDGNEVGCPSSALHHSLGVSSHTSHLCCDPCSCLFLCPTSDISDCAYDHGTSDEGGGVRVSDGVTGGGR